MIRGAGLAAGVCLLLAAPVRADVPNIGPGSGSTAFVRVEGPNPSRALRQIVTVGSSGTADIGSVKLVDSQGRTVGVLPINMRMSGSTGFELSTAGLTSGVYFVAVTSRDQSDLLAATRLVLVR